MDARYQRNLPALSEEECLRLQQAQIAIVGCGGLGGHLAELCARIGIGSIRVIDGDVFEETNLNRQLLCEEALLGTSKAEAAQARIVRINATIHVDARPIMLDADNANTLVADCVLVFDALDGIEARRILALACREAATPYVYGAIRGWVAQAALVRPEENLLDKLYPPNVRLEDKSALSFTPALCAALQVSLGVRYLCDRPCASGILHYLDLLSDDYELIPLV